MKKQFGVVSLALAVLMTLCLAVSPAVAEEGAKSLRESAGLSKTLRQGGDVGVGLGSATLTSGLAFKYYLGETTAIQGALGVSGWGFGLGADYIIERDPIWQHNSGNLIWHYGAGVGASTYSAWNKTGFYAGASGLIGLGYQFRNFPLELTTELRATVYFGTINRFFPRPGGSGAIRYFF